MTPALLDFTVSDLNNYVYALSMRCAYLAAGSVIIMGTHWNSYNTIGTAQEWPEKAKLRLVLQALNDKEAEQKVKEAMAAMNTLKAKKRLSQAAFVALKGAEKYMEANFQLVFNAIKRNIYEYGFMEINEDFLKTKNLSTISICEEGKETTDDISISTALLTMYDNEATDWTTIPPGLELQLIMLPEDFFEWCQHKHTLYHTDCEAANQVSQLFMTTCFSVPNTTKLSLEEMMLAHRTFTSGLSPWRTAADHWVKTGIENETGMVGSYFANVQMHNKSAQQTIDNNMVMEHAKRSHPTGEHVEIMLN